MATRVLAVSVALCAAASHAFVVPKTRVAPTTLNGKDSDVEELVSASMYGSAADVASKALALADRTAAAEKGVEVLLGEMEALRATAARAEAAEQKLEATTVALEALREERESFLAEREAEVEAIEAATAESMQARKRVAELEDALAALDRKLATATRDASAASERADAAQAEADALALKRDRAVERLAVSRRDNEGLQEVLGRQADLVEKSQANYEKSLAGLFSRRLAAFRTRHRST